MNQTARGYGIEATLTDDALHVRATTYPGRMSLLGPGGGDEVTIPLDEIVSARHNRPGGFGFVNGLLDVRTTGGKRYQMHYRRGKKDRDFAAFAESVVAAVTHAQSA